MPDLSATTPDVTTSDRPAFSVRRLAIVSLGTLLTGLVGGLVWLWLARPAEWEGRNGGLVLTEFAARGQFSVVVVFVLVGVVASIVSGAVTARMLPDLGWPAVPLVLLLSALAALVAWRVGVELGPPDPSTVAGVSDGDRVPARLAVDTPAAFLVWPIFGLLGLVVATWSDGRRDAGAGAGRGGVGAVSERYEPRQHG